MRTAFSKQVVLTLIICVSKWRCDAFVELPMRVTLAPQHLDYQNRVLKSFTSENNLNRNLNLSLQEGMSFFREESPLAKSRNAMIICAALFTFLTSTPPALAATGPEVFTGSYNDPNHPMCQRQIKVSGDGKSFHYTGTAVGSDGGDSVRRGCTDAEIKVFGLRRGEFDGVIINGDKISAGDGVHEGTWEPARTATDMSLSGVNVDGIRWNDGNKWTKIEVKGTIDKAYGQGIEGVFGL